MSIWGEIGGEWIQEGIPQFVTLDRKPENRSEHRALACKESELRFMSGPKKAEVQETYVCRGQE